MTTCLFRAASADANPATRPADPVGEMRELNLPAFNFTYLSGETSIAGLPQFIDKMIANLNAEMEVGQIKVAGPVIFIYHGMTQEPNRKFTMEIGVVSKGDAKPPEGFKVRKLEPFHCAAVLYTGPVAGIGAAWGKLYGAMGTARLQPAEESREMYVYWEGSESPNNVIWVQAGLSK
jgi:predicted transcriptional regulator YdeE